MQIIAEHAPKPETSAFPAAKQADKLMVALAFMLVITLMSATIFNIVLPEIKADFGLSLTQASWMSSAYLLIYAIGTVFYGKLADRFGMKQVVTFGLIVFACGSLIGLASQAYGTVLLARVVQAMGAAVIPAAASIIPVSYFPPERRGRALGISMTGLALGNVIGPVVAAAVVSAVHWRWLFGLPLLALLILPFLRRYLSGGTGMAGKLDVVGGLLLALAVASLLLTVSYEAWMAAPLALFMILFVWRIRSVKEPFIRPGLFRSRRYSTGLLLAFLTTFAGYSLPFLSPQLLAEVNGVSAGLIGFAMVPAAAATALLGRKGGRLADAKGNSFVVYMASCLLLVCLLLLSTFAGISPYWISGFLIVGSVGHSWLYLALSNAISRSLPKEEAGVGMGLLAMLNFIAGASAAGVYGISIDQGGGSGWNPLHDQPEAAAFSNLYLILAVLLVVMAAVYRYLFDTGRKIK